MKCLQPLLRGANIARASHHTARVPANPSDIGVTCHDYAAKDLAVGDQKGSIFRNHSLQLYRLLVYDTVQRLWTLFLFASGRMVAKLVHRFRVHGMRQLFHGVY